jgi:Fe2+ or Zn2+ uptake regulation protein
MTEEPMYRPDNPAYSLKHSAAADWRAAVEAAVRGAGPRTSAARNAVLDWIAAAERPFTAETIVQQLADWDHGSRTTVYRTLDWLRASGWLLRLHNDGHDRAYARSLPDAHQVVCTGCGGVQTLTGLELAPLLDARLRTLGFELRGQHLELYGRCRLCQLAASDGYEPHFEEESHR